MKTYRNAGFTFVALTLAIGAAASGLAPNVAAQPAQGGAAQGAAAKGTATAGQTVTKRVEAGADAGKAGDAGTAGDASTAALTPAPVDTAIAAPMAISSGLAAAPTSFKSPPPPPPTPEQVTALGKMKTEVEAYSKGAKDYRDTVTSIIRLHYENKKREVLTDLDSEIGIERTELGKARATAIKKLEDFVAAYSGSRAHPEATPDAMYRLAALYEERARSEESAEPIEIGLKPAINLYKRIIAEYPVYKELAGVFYFLGHAYNDSGRLDEAQQVWRSLVCHNKFGYPVAADPKKPDHDSITPMPQDNDTTYWTAWRHQYRDPRFVKKTNPETSYNEIYPRECVPLAQPNLAPGVDPKYVAEIWWQIGNWEFDQLDIGGGVVADEPASVWDYNRAASAYLRAMQSKKPPLFGVSLYKYAWTLYKQQRYEAATRQFITLLVYTDDQQKLTGDPGADFRGEAYTYIAGSLTNMEFAGPEEWEPYIQRPDIMDTEPRQDVAEKKLHIAIDRVKDPAIIPQDKPWTIEIYKALATEFRSLNQSLNAIEVYELVLKKYPMDPSAPEVQAGIADTYEQLGATKKTGTPEHEAIAAKTLEARTALSNYIGDTPWTQANKDNPGALRNAERLVRGGLRQAAVAHTNNGKAALVSAGDTGDQGRQLDLLSRASSEYKLAAIGWRGFLKQDENAPDAYESRYWLADSLHQYVRIQVTLHKVKPRDYAEPSRAEIDDAKATSADVRDSNEDDKYLDNAAYFVVDIADIDRDLAYLRFDDTKGASGIEKREEVKFAGEGKERKVQRDIVPPVVLQSVQARDEYVQRVPANLDVSKHGLDYQYFAGETYFLYGQFDLARQRFEPMYKNECGKTSYGYKAWEKLITMSNLEGRVDESTRLAEEVKTKTCATKPDEAGTEQLIVNPTLQEAAYVRARAKFEEAKKAAPGPERDKLWREAAGQYEAALSAAPGRDEAPEAAMNAAYAYKQVGDFAKAIELYNKFISEYGSEDRLTKLEKGDPKTKAAPDLAKYKERIDYLDKAYDALGTTYYSFFNYQRAAETYEKVANNGRFPDDKRKVAANNAMVLYGSMAQRDKMDAQYRQYISLKPTTDEKALADYLVATYDYKQWNPKGGDSGQNRSTRLAAEKALADFYTKNGPNNAAAKYNLEAVYSIAKMRKVIAEGYRPWFKTTIAAWEKWKSVAPSKDGKSEALLAPWVDYVAEAEFTIVDEDVRDKYETDGKHKYVGAVEDIVGKTDPKTNAVTKSGKYQENAKDADKWDKELDRIGRAYPSLEWVPAVLARQGTIWDTLRTGLYNTVPPALKYFTTAQEAQLKVLDNSGRQELEDKANEIRDTVKAGWRTRKESELRATDALMVKRYAQAISVSRRYNVRNAQVTRAVGRLAYFTDILGDVKMKEYVTATPDPVDATKRIDYADGQYVQTRPGMTAVPAANGLANPTPVAP